MNRRLFFGPPKAMLVLRRLYAIDGVSGTQATVALETFFERPVSPHAEGS